MQQDWTPQEPEHHPHFGHRISASAPSKISCWILHRFKSDIFTFTLKPLPFFLGTMVNLCAAADLEHIEWT